MKNVYNEHTKNKNYGSEILYKYFWTDFAKDKCYVDTKYYVDNGVTLQLILAKYFLIEPLSVNDLNNLYDNIALRNCSDHYLRKWHQSIKFKWSKQLSHLNIVVGKLG